MPRYCVITRVINEWEGIFEAPDEDEARAFAYAEVEDEISTNGYAEHTVILIQE